MEKVCGQIPQVINLKELIKIIEKMVVEYSNGVVEMYIEETFLMILDMVLDKCLGIMDLGTKGIGNMVNNKEKDRCMKKDILLTKEYLKATL